MEGQDAFTQEITEGDDPFAGSDFGDFEQPAQRVEAELPTVDREGNRVQPEPVSAESPGVREPEQVAAADQDGRTELERQEDSYQYKVSHGEPVPEELEHAHAEYQRQQNPQAASYTEAVAAEVAEPVEVPGTVETMEGRPGEAVNAETGEVTQPGESLPEALSEQPQSDPTSSPSATGDVSSSATDGESSDPTSSSSEAVPPEPTTDAPEQPVAIEAGEIETPTPEPAAEEAPEPEETKDKRGRVTNRKYVVLRADGPGEFSQVHWHEKDGKMVERGTKGAKRQTVALARGAEEALKIGYAACGSPQNGVTLVAVAAAYFQPKPVAPMPPEPMKQRLKIG